jgi:hypothetical protein
MQSGRLELIEMLLLEVTSVFFLRTNLLFDGNVVLVLIVLMLFFVLYGILVFPLRYFLNRPCGFYLSYLLVPNVITGIYNALFL